MELGAAALIGMGLCAAGFAGPQSGGDCALKQRLLLTTTASTNKTLLGLCLDPQSGGVVPSSKGF